MISYKLMSDAAYERRVKIEEMLRTTAYQLWGQVTAHLRNTYCPTFSPMSRITEDACESCNNYEVCSNIEEKKEIIPQTLLELTL